MGLEGTATDESPCAFRDNCDDQIPWQQSDGLGLLPQRTTGDVQFEIRQKSGVQATAVEEDGECIVLEGSEALNQTNQRS